MAENDVSSKTIGALNGIPFESIIGGPLSACIKAQAEAAVSTVNFIESVGLKQSEGGVKEAVYVVFSYVQNGRRVNISVPLLTIVPIPYIAINNISIDFKVAINGTESSEIEDIESQQTDSTSTTESKKGGGWLTKRKTSKFTSSISTKKDSRATQDSTYSIEATMDVKVQASQESMPAGMAKVLGMLSDAMDVVSEQGDLTVDGPYIEGDGNNAKKYIIVTYKDPTGLFTTQGVTCDGSSGEVVRNGEALKFSFAATTQGEKVIKVAPSGGSSDKTNALTRTINL